jgi:hypothetical protein
MAQFLPLLIVILLCGWAVLGWQKSEQFFAAIWQNH